MERGSKSDKTGPEQPQKGLTTAKRYQRGRNPVWGERAKHGLRDRRGYSRAAHTHSAAQHSPWAHERRLKKNCRREEIDWGESLLCLESSLALSFHLGLPQDGGMLGRAL